MGYGCFGKVFVSGYIQSDLNKFTPIILFVYNRPEHTRQTIESLLLNIHADESILFIYSDAPKNQQSEENVQAVRSYIKTIKGFKFITIIEREKNCGLANSIIDGVTNIVNQYGKVIVLEDDMITSPYFLTYMNDGLTLFENDYRVASIHGYIYPVKKKLPNYFFLRSADCWGWATWKRAWDLFNPDGQYLLNEIKKQNMEKLFNFNGSYNYTGMLQEQINGKVSSWAIRWYASVFLANKYTLYPGSSLVRNIGLDGSGTHCGDTSNYNTDFSIIYLPISPLDVNDSTVARKIITQYFYNIGKISIVNKLIKYIKRKSTL
jgi:hypothetical protein